MITKMLQLHSVDLLSYYKEKKEYQIPIQAITSNVHISFFAKIFAEINDLNIKSTKITLKEFHTLEDIDDLDLRGMVMAGIGGTQTFIGNYKKALAAFCRAEELIRKPEAAAYLQLELSNLYRKLGYKKEAIQMIDKAIKVINIESLQWKLKWQKAFSYKFIDEELSLRLFAEVLQHYRRENNRLEAARAQRRMGQVYDNRREYDKALSMYNKAMEVAVELELQHFQYEILNDKGWNFVLQKKYDQAQSLFLDLIRLDDLSPYEKSLALQNLGVISFKRNNYREAIQYHSQSMHLTTQYEMRNMLYEDYYKLGLCHERLGEISMADFFYYSGYREFQVEYELYLALSKDQKTLLDSYIKFLRQNLKVTNINIKDEIFGFALDKPLGEIRAIFHKHLLTLHLGRTKTAPELCQKLGIYTRTYFLYQKKLGLKRGEMPKLPLADNTHFAQYLETLTPLTWKEANRRFERDLYSFLLEKYQYNRKKLAEVLQVSYQQVVMKAKQTL
ncbi:MAG: tetratricopeptide repeat protein [Fidelibacterota bacterium]